MTHWVILTETRFITSAAPRFDTDSGKLDDRSSIIGAADGGVRSDGIFNRGLCD
jgi:hypothetical protein